MKVIIQQPVVPKYRVPLFNALAEKIDLEVHGSLSIPGLPGSANPETFKFKFFEHSCRTYLCGKFYIQNNLTVPKHFSQTDILVYNSNPRFISNFKFVAEGKKRGMRTIAWNHALSSTSGKISSWFRHKLTARNTDNLLLYTEGEVEIMLREGWAKEKIFYLNNTVNEQEILDAIERFTHERDIKIARKSEEVAEFKKSQNFSNGLNLLYCGRITEKSNLEFLINVLSQINKKINLVVIGDGEFRSDLEKMAGEKKVFIRWLGAIYDEDKLAPWFLASDIFIYPGAIGLSLNHAMAYGLPVITHDAKELQMPEFHYLKHNHNGWCYKIDEEESLVSLLENLDSDSLEQFQQESIKSIYEQFSFKNMVANFLNCLEKK